jgi:hypothetical protein
MMLTCLKESGITTPADFKGKTLGVWFGGNEYPFLNWMGKLGLKTDGTRWGDGAEAGLQRRPAAAKAGGLHLDHDLQRILAGHRCRHDARATDHLQVRGRRRGDAGGRPLCHAGQAGRSGLCRDKMVRFVRPR